MTILTKTGVPALATSFVVLSSLGCAYVAHVWLARTLPVDAALRCITLVTSLLAVHLVSLNELRWQARRPAIRLIDRVRLNVRRLRGHAPWGMIFIPQLAVIGFASLLLDGGDVLNICIGAAIVFWGVVGCSILWRTRPLSKLDLTMLRYGYFSLLPIIFSCWSIVITLKAGHYYRR